MRFANHCILLLFMFYTKSQLFWKWWLYRHHINEKKKEEEIEILHHSATPPSLVLMLHQQLNCLFLHFSLFANKVRQGCNKPEETLGMKGLCFFMPKSVKKTKHLILSGLLFLSRLFIWITWASVTTLFCWFLFFLDIYKNSYLTFLFQGRQTSRFGLIKVPVNW